MLIRFFAVWSLPVALMTVCAPWALSQSYPVRPVRIVTFLPGGSADFAARLVSTPLAAALGQPVIVDNRPSNIIQAQIVSKAQPDGHTLLLVANSFTLAPLFQKVPYDPVNDFSPISLLTTSPNILVVHPSVPVTSAQPSALVPGVPTIAASVPGYESTGTNALFAPARTPPAIVNRLNQEVVRILHTPDVKEKFLNSGTEVVGSTADHLAAAIKSDRARVSKALKTAGARAE